MRSTCRNMRASDRSRAKPNLNMVLKTGLSSSCMNSAALCLHSSTNINAPMLLADSSRLGSCALVEAAAETELQQVSQGMCGGRR